MRCYSGDCDREATFALQHPPGEANGYYCGDCADELQALDPDWVVVNRV